MICATNTLVTKPCLSAKLKILPKHQRMRVKLSKKLSVKNTHVKCNWTRLLRSSRVPSAVNGASLRAGCSKAPCSLTRRRLNSRSLKV